MIHKARVRLWGLQTTIIAVGGYSNTIFGGYALGKNDRGIDECEADLTFGDSVGLGVSFHWTSHELPYDCENVDCAFSNGDKVELTVITLLFFTIYKMDFRFCTSKTSGWKFGIGLGLGYQGCTWTIANVLPL